MKILSKAVVFGLFGILICSIFYAGGGSCSLCKTDSEEVTTPPMSSRKLPKQEHPLERVAYVAPILSFLDAKSAINLAMTNTTCSESLTYGTSEKVMERIKDYRKLALAGLFKFAKIPAGRLPNGTQIVAHEASRYPVTQKLWQEIMGSLPQGVQPNCPNCPVTHVNWENSDGTPAEVQTFLIRLNQRTAALGCTYDLPTDDQLHYEIRGDQSGQNQDFYSSGVTAKNVDQYVTYWGNSNPNGTGNSIQPVGQKSLNNFGIELGNVWKMSKDIYDPANPQYGRSVRGGSWHSDVSNAGSGVRGSALAGNRFDFMGFSLVRTCH